MAQKESNMSAEPKKKGGRPPGRTMPCGWGCGATFTSVGMRKHFAECPNRDVGTTLSAAPVEAETTVPTTMPEESTGVLLDQEPMLIGEALAEMARAEPVQVGRPWLPELVRLRDLAQTDAASSAREFLEMVKGVRQPAGWSDMTVSQQADWLDENKPLPERW